MQATLTRPTDETAYVVTDAGLDARRLAEAQETAQNAPTFTADGPDAPDVITDAPQGEAFTPDTTDKADWVLCKIADHRARAARIREHAEAMAKQAEADATFLEWKYGAALQDLARRELAGGKRKSLTLFHGVLGFRSKPAGCQIGDTKAALVWARENLPAAVVETVDRAAVTKALLETGEAVDFAAFNPAEEVFYIK